MSRLINELIRTGYLRSDPIIDAFAQISRVEFVPDDLIGAAEMDIPLPIGHGQTISQPLTVAFMMELLDPRKGNKVLDVGSGSGWTTALLAHIVGQTGQVTSLELIAQLCQRGEHNVEKFGFVSAGIASFHCLDGSKGYAPHAPYDRILVSAAAEKVPQALKEQLKIGGKMVIPIRNNICYLEKKEDGSFAQEKFGGFSFVPLLERR